MQYRRKVPRSVRRVATQFLCSQKQLVMSIHAVEMTLQRSVKRDNLYKTESKTYFTNAILFKEIKLITTQEIDYMFMTEF
jgi:hypothetical protein